MTAHEIDRRRFLSATAATAAAGLLAGCSDDEPDDAGGGGDDDSGGEDEEVDGFEIEPGTEIALDGYTQQWEGVEPDPIAGEDNPTLILEDGGDYTIQWTNGENIPHDLQIWDENDDVVDDLATESLDTEGESASLEFTASSEMVTYVCSYHITTQVGDIVVQ